MNIFSLMPSFLGPAIAFMVALSAPAQAATLIFSNAAASPQAFATGFADKAGDESAGLLWGVVVDAQGNGINFNDWTYGFVLERNFEGTILSQKQGMPDDVLFLHSTPTTARTGDGASFSGSVNTIPNVPYLNGVGPGDHFAIIWFDRGTEVGDLIDWTKAIGLLTTGRNPSPEFVLPEGEADAFDFSPAFLGLDPVKTTNLYWVPEPSSLILSALGGLVLLRRRR